MPRNSPATTWETFVRELGTAVHRARVARGLSQERVAYAAGLSRYTYQKLEKGESSPGEAANPRLKTLLAVAQVLQVDLVDLLPAHLPDLTAR